MIHKKFALLILVTTLSISTTSIAISVKQCDVEAATALEETYCAVLKKGHGQSLPDFFSFRRNPNHMQRLILKSAASRAGVELPAKETRANSFAESLRPEITSDNKGGKTEVAQRSAKQSNSAEDKRQGLSPSADTLAPTKEKYLKESLDNCSIAKEQIACGHQRYFLAINVPIKHLNKNALSADNRLLFRTKSQNETLLQYLSHLYPEYIQKMLHIGLGDSTVSFTKFHAIYESSLAQNENFVDRFEEMYELLKKERQTMATKQRYRENYPDNINNCMQLTSGLITCDNVEQNWVYKKVRSF
ncbi:MAG: hypothetical protein K6L81_17985 [Agarilytica sp.]